MMRHRLFSIHLKMAKIIYPYKVKKEAGKIMSRILKYPEQVDSRIDNKVCRVTLIRSIDADLKGQFIEEYKADNLYQIEVQGITEKDFLVLESLLENLDEVIVEVRD